MRGRRPVFWLLAIAACTRPEVKNAPEAAMASSSASPPPAAGHPIARPADAVAEFGVLTERPKEELVKLLTPDALAAALETRHCGPPPACDAVRAFIKDRERVELRVAPADDWGIPQEPALAYVSKGLSREERASVPKRKSVVVVRATGKTTREQVVARAGFAVTAAIAERIKGLVYDEIVRRIETAEQFAAHAIAAPLGEGAFREDRIVIQFYEQDDGTSRLVSLGMRRFGAPDLEIRGAQAGAGRALGGVMNAIATLLVDGAADAPVVIPLGRKATVDLVVPPHQEGDPDNTIVRLVPGGGANVKGYDDLVASSFGAAEQLVAQTDDAALTAAHNRAVRAFPGAVLRWKKMPEPRPLLLVKLPFSIPGDAGVEWMWVEVKSIDESSIAGTLANSPAYVTDLRGGAPVKGRRKDVYDYLVKSADGGTEGGETIKILENRR